MVPGLARGTKSSCFSSSTPINAALALTSVFVAGFARRSRRGNKPAFLNGRRSSRSVAQLQATVESAVLVTVDIKPDRIDDFLKAMEVDVKGSRDAEKDPGCLRFDLLRDREDPQKFVFYEVYKDDEAAAFHKTTAHYNAWADFKASGGVASQSVVKVETASMPGDWAFQVEASGAEPTASAVLVTVEINEDRIEDFLQAMEIDVKGSRDEKSDPGCCRFDLLRLRDEPNKFVFYEAYTDDEAAAFHKTTKHYQAWADFKSTGGVASQTVAKVETASIPGKWAFQP